MTRQGSFFERGSPPPPPVILLSLLASSWARAADDRLFEVLGQVGLARPVDGQRVDDDALLDDKIAHLLDRLTQGVGAVARQIDYLPYLVDLD